MEVLKYKIDDGYVGPVVVFIYTDPKNVDDTNVATINRDGLGGVRSSKLSSKFIFISAQTEKELLIINIGEEMGADKNVRAVYGLVKGQASSKCSIGNLSMIVFFVGVKSDFENWSKMRVTELKYMEQRGIDWCWFYRSHLK